MFIVVSEESGEREVLGEYARTDEDVVVYWEWETGLLMYAPADCVEVVPGFVEYKGPGGLQEA